MWNVVNTGTSDSSASATTETDAATPTLSSRTAAKREMACGIIISALGDAPLRVVMDVDDDPGKMLDLLDARYASNRTVSRIAVQTQLFRMSYSGQDMASYVDQYTSLFSQLERMGKDAAISESHKAPMLLASIDPNCFLESTAAALRTKESSELTWEYVATTLIDEYNALIWCSGIEFLTSSMEKQGSTQEEQGVRLRHERRLRLIRCRKYCSSVSCCTAYREQESSVGV